ncbi:MAG TPA: transketolase C-terminal domain-containing protein [Gemmatimonadaceae bacterium]|nr:transketolase C-terminal domain-containing protein [Gemmatimonadaceae bacterium]
MTAGATYLIPFEEFKRVNTAPLGKDERLALIADMCRLNALSAVKRAGSGHLGSSFSAMDIMVLLYHDLLNVRSLGVSNPHRDIFLSSKGHDVPAQYSVLFSLGIVSREKLLRLRRLDGLEGHPNVQVPGIEANTGSLGMGISKGRGFAVAKRLLNLGGRVVVMTGDGELQEGQVYEALQTTVHQKVGITVVVDHNQLQSDRPVVEITNLGDVVAKLGAFGWHVERCDGHDFPGLRRAFERCFALAGQPGIIVADTVKGRGVSFMEGPAALREGRGTYKWHAGAPDDESFLRAHDELVGRIMERCARGNLAPVEVEPIPLERKPSTVSEEYVVEAFGRRLVELAARRPDLVVLDGDLAADCRVRYFELEVPARFIENGIAEQDMVSMAGALARQGLLPVVNSFASFLAARANEQIYNNVTERSKVIYACHFGGLIPAGPGPSHQSVRDISLLSALPGVTIVEPCNAVETTRLLDWCVDDAAASCVIRLAIGPCPRRITLPEDYRPLLGVGTLLRRGTDVLAFSYGPVMLHEVLTAAESLDAQGLSVAVVNMPWLNVVDRSWLRALVSSYEIIVTIEDHSSVGGLGDAMLRTLAEEDLLRRRRHWTFGCDDIPVCGAPGEVLNRHRLDASSIARRLVAIAETAGRVHTLPGVARVGSEDAADAPIG